MTTISCRLPGLVPVTVLAEQTALPALLADTVHLAEPGIKSRSANAAPKLAKQVLRKGLSPLAATINTDTAAPVIAGMRLRVGRSARARASPDGRPSRGHRPRRGVTGQILVRGASAYGTRTVVPAAAPAHGSRWY